LPSKDEKPVKADKVKTTARLEAKGVDKATAKHLSGEDEQLSAKEIADRRIAWQKTLQKKK